MISFSDEQAMLLESAVRFCREKSPVSTVRSLLASETGFDENLWNEMTALGWTGIAVPEHHGGTGLSIAEAAIIAEPMGRHLLATPFVGTQLFVQGLLAAGGNGPWLERIAAGGVGTVALFEADGAWDLANVETTATRMGQTLTLSGIKTLVCDAAAAEVFLVSALLDNTPVLAIVPATGLPPGAIQRETVIDQTRRSYRLDLTGCEIPAAALIDNPAAGFRAIRDAALLLASAEAAGGIAAVLDLTVEYLNTRTAFGRKIGGFQSLKHTCADILVGLERTRSHLYHAISLTSVGEDAEIASRMAKACSGDTFTVAGDRAVQFHGGFGFTFECDAQLFLRRSIWLDYWFGDAAHHRRKLADLLLPRP